jgi:hypothetical protein
VHIFRLGGIYGPSRRLVFDRLVLSRPRSETEGFKPSKLLPRAGRAEIGEGSAGRNLPLTPAADTLVSVRCTLHDESVVLHSVFDMGGCVAPERSPEKVWGKEIS